MLKSYMYAVYNKVHHKLSHKEKKTVVQALLRYKSSLKLSVYTWYLSLLKRKLYCTMIIRMQ